MKIKFMFLIVLALLLSATYLFSDNIGSKRVDANGVTREIRENGRELITINFVGGAPPFFNEAYPITTEYEYLGVTFEGPNEGSGGAVLEENGSFGVSGFSFPNILAFNNGAALITGGIAEGPEVIIFENPVPYVVIKAGHADAGQITMDALDEYGNILGSDQINGNSSLISMSVTFDNICAVMLSYTGSFCVFDNLSYEMEFANYGDVDDNGTVQAFDASLVLQYAVGLDPLPEIDPRPWEDWRIIVSDVDGNEDVQAFDASLILQYVVGLITVFPVEESGNYVAPIANVNILIEENELIFEADSNLFAFTINTDNSVIIFGEPITNMMYEKNGNHIAMCSSEPQSGIFLRIPFALQDIASIGNLDEIVTLNMVVNTEEIIETINTTISNKSNIEDYNNNFSVYPNPFNPITSLKFSVPFNNTFTDVSIFNIKGELVKIIVKENLNIGKYVYQWTGKDIQGKNVGSGIYFYKAQIGKRIYSGKIVLMK